MVPGLADDNLGAIQLILSGLQILVQLSAPTNKTQWLLQYSHLPHPRRLCRPPRQEINTEGPSLRSVNSQLIVNRFVLKVV